ncbi:hypothetical protein HK097_006277 [Rhizophlyctis rosea]|uniref:DUF1279 domain-containing protein n=1 Tax=Rhizophlyctis rosea TaxID=64517 RepID=A0AAD5SEG8_9FUNG|nr:hypothetical protein HK097_006277 [Rhizophlyctis rosea]
MRITDLDAPALARTLHFSDATADVLAARGGTVAVAFALSKLFTPVKLLVCLVVVPRVADRINAVVVPWWDSVKLRWARWGQGPGAGGNIDTDSLLASDFGPGYKVEKVLEGKAA